MVGAREASRLIRQDDWVVIDGDAGVVIVDPSPIVLEPSTGFKQRQSELERGAAGAPAPHAGGDARRRDGRAAGQHRAARATRPAALEAGAVGVGLFRSEFLFMNRDGDLPGEDEQFEAYRARGGGACRACR